VKLRLGSGWPVLVGLGCCCLLGARAATAAIIVFTNEKTITRAGETHVIGTPPGPIQVTQEVSPAAVALPDGGFEVHVNDKGSYSHGGGIQQGEGWRQVKFTFAFELDAPAEYSYHSGAWDVVHYPDTYSPGTVTFDGGPTLPTPPPNAPADASGVLPAGRYTLTGIAGELPPYSQPAQPNPVPVGYWVFNDFTFRVAPEPAALGTLLGGAALLILRRDRRSDMR
jgi:hypothetical protein